MYICGSPDTLAGELLLKYQIINISNPVIALRMLNMGIMAGKKLEFVRRAPFGGAVYIKMDHAFYVLRGDEWDALDCRLLEEDERKI